MIHEIGVELQAFFVSRGAGGFPVIDGPEIRGTSTYSRERVVLEHDMEGGDTYGSRLRADHNPRTRLTRDVGYKVTVYAQYPRKGAIYWEHKQRAEKVMDMVQVGLDRIVKARQNIIQFRSSKFEFPPDLKDGETPGGAVYVMYCTIDRGVADRMWNDAPPHASATIVAPYASGGPYITAITTVSGFTQDGGSSTEDI